MEEQQVRSRLQVWATLGVALRVYRLLFLRSVTTAAAVYAVIALTNLAHHATSGSGAQALALLSFIGTLAGPLVVQGALVEIVRNVHEGRPPEPIAELVKRGSKRLWPLLGASIVYAFGVAIGLLLLLVPGLIVAARWSLLAPLVVLEGRGVSAARQRSTELVIGQTREVLTCVVVMYVAISWFAWALLLSHTAFGTTVFLVFVWSALTAPFQAHMLTVIYYRLADPERPVIDPKVPGWRSVWEGR